MGSHTRLVNTVDIPPPLKEPSFEVLAKPARKMPSSNFSVDYGSAEGLSAFKATWERGVLQLVPAFKQGFTGQAAERYPTGETFVGDFVDGRRHGRGTYTTDEGHLLSTFQFGRPAFEGTQLRMSPPAPGKPPVVEKAHRTHEGKLDDEIPLSEARRIAERVGLRMPGATTDPLTPIGTRNRAWYDGEEDRYAGTSTETSEGKLSQPDFLTRLAAVEEREISNVHSAGANFTIVPLPRLSPKPEPGAAGKRPPKARSGSHGPAFA
uniref:MORN repeat-containing protein 5 n=1 Tax=Haptolina brevifila TaxID=156173 RepID=A0A7S2HYH8_9EUKA|mmetsp:Transcript_59067/g.117380  ORF Transcript_59067/g.117380 Transcript_59067/m.117380 type:complete len:265 (+) Transcript_59067:74-868(+)